MSAPKSGPRLSPEGRSPAWTAALACGLLACAGEAAVPEVDGLDELSIEYDAPSAELDETSARELVDASPELESILSGLRSTGDVVDEIDEATEPAQARSNEGVRLRGKLVITLRCPGNIEEPSYDEAENGSVTLTLGVLRNAVRRGVVGEANACKLSGTVAGRQVPVEIDGPVLLDLGEDFPLSEGWSGERLLVSLPGRVTVGDFSFEGVTARITPDGVEHLLRLGDGSTVVVSVNSDSVSVRDRERTWTCSRTGGPCEVP